MLNLNCVALMDTLRSVDPVRVPLRQLASTLGENSIILFIPARSQGVESTDGLRVISTSCFACRAVNLFISSLYRSGLVSCRLSK